MPAQSLTETYTGSVVDWYVPNHTAGTLRVTCRGADGARAAGTPNGGGGYGGSVRGYLSVAPGTLLKLVVGAHGSNLSPPSFMAKGGFPHGLTTVARGGCATEVWDASSARIMVAGGGGSGAYGSSGGSGGGYRGGLGIANGEGESSGVYSFGGTTSAHGAAGANAGGGGTAATAGSSAGGGSNPAQLVGVDLKDVTINGDVTLDSQCVIRSNVKGVKRSPRPQGLMVGA